MPTPTARTREMDAAIRELQRVAGPLFVTLQQSNMAMVVTDPRLPDNPIIFVNDAFAALTGYDAAAAVGRNCRFLQGPGTDPAMVQQIREGIERGVPVNVEILNIRRNGQTFWNKLFIAPVPADNEQPRFFFATQVDNTLAHRAAEAERDLQATEERLQVASERLSTALALSGYAASWDWDVTTGRITGDARFAAMYGLEAADAVAGVEAATFFTIIHPQDQARIRLAVGAMLRGAELFAKEFRVLLQGATRWVRARGRATLDAEGRPLHFAGVMVDVTEQKLVGEQLRIAQSAGGIGTFSYVEGFATLSVSAQFCAALGLHPAAILPVRTVNALVDPRGGPVVPEAGHFAPGDARQVEIRIRRPDNGQERWIACRGEFALDSESTALRFTGVVYDVTDTKRIEQRLRELNDTLEARVQERTRERDQIWQASSDLLCVANFEGRLLSLNPAWTRLLGWSEEELKAVPLMELVHPEDREATRAANRQLAGGVPQLGFRNRYRHRDGSYRWFSWNAVPREGQVYSVVRDVTAAHEQEERAKALEEQLRQSQKMEAVGQLTGGLAHDFNNLLAGIAGSLELMQTRIAQGRLGDVDRYIEAAQGATRRAAALTHRLLAFSRRQTLAPKPIDLNRLVSGMEELVRRTVGPGIDIAVEGAGNLWLTLVDPPQLENALLNLCINARDAMPAGGRLTIATANHTIDGPMGREQDLPPGHYVSLCVTDTGTGMPADVIAKAFDPFFTTKPIGQGTGLGLSMIYGFARQSGGQVHIASEVGRGTAVSLYLPRHVGEADGEETPAGLKAVPRARQGETVLIVDDEPTIRMLVVDVLEDLGYQAIEAGDGGAGLRVLQSDARIDLLITDVGLPGGMNGRQMADAGRQARPGLKVLFITGYAESAVLGDGHLEPGMQVMTKPFAVEALASRIRELIALG